ARAVRGTGQAWPRGCRAERPDPSQNRRRPRPSGTPFSAGGGLSQGRSAPARLTRRSAPGASDDEKARERIERLSARAFRISFRKTRAVDVEEPAQLVLGQTFEDRTEPRSLHPFQHRILSCEDLVVSR